MSASLAGVYVPYHPHKATFILLESSNGLLLPLFSDLDKYNEASKWGNFVYANCIKVTDNDGFLKTLIELKKKFSFTIALDPFINDKGNTCFKVVNVG